MATKLKRKKKRKEEHSTISVTERYSFPTNQGTSIAIHPGLSILYICDVMKQRIEAYSLDGYSITSFGENVLKYSGA